MLLGPYHHERDVADVDAGHAGDFGDVDLQFRLLRRHEVLAGLAEGFLLVGAEVAACTEGVAGDFDALVFGD